MTFQREAHSIKSSSANVGAMRVQAIALQLETAATSGSFDGLEERIKNLVAEFDSYQKTISSQA